MLDRDGTGCRLSFYQNSGLTLLSYIFFGLLVLGLTAFMHNSIKRVTILSGDKKAAYYTFAPTVREVIAEIGIKEKIRLLKAPDLLAENETVDYYTISEDLAAKVTDGMKIRVYRNRIEKRVEKTNVAAPIQRDWDIFLEAGRERLISPGQNGLLKNTLLLYYRDGMVVSRRLTKSQMVIAARPKVIASGSYEIVSRQYKAHSGRPVKFISTAYTYTGSHTAVGAATRRGIVAVDPKVIRLGTRMYIEGYGFAVAADTGGAIKGKKIDVFLKTPHEAVKWGRRLVNVYFL